MKRNFKFNSEERACEISLPWSLLGNSRKYSRTPVTQTLKGNKKQFELARVRVVGVDCKIQFAMLTIDSSDFSVLQCMLQSKLFYYIISSETETWLGIVYDETWSISFTN